MSSEDDLLLKWNVLLIPDGEYASPLLLESLEDGALKNPLEGAGVHGDDGQVAGERNFIFERELKKSFHRREKHNVMAEFRYLGDESIFSWSNNKRFVPNLSSRGLVV